MDSQHFFSKEELGSSESDDECVQNHEEITPDGQISYSYHHDHHHRQRSGNRDTRINNSKGYGIGDGCMAEEETNRGEVMETFQRQTSKSGLKPDPKNAQTRRKRSHKGAFGNQGCLSDCSCEEHEKSGTENSNRNNSNPGNEGSVHRSDSGPGRRRSSQKEAFSSDHTVPNASSPETEAMSAQFHSDTEFITISKETNEREALYSSGVLNVNSRLQDSFVGAVNVASHVNLSTNNFDNAADRLSSILAKNIHNNGTVDSSMTCNRSVSTGTVTCMYDETVDSCLQLIPEHVRTITGIPNGDEIKLDLFQQGSSCDLSIDEVPCVKNLPQTLPRVVDSLPSSDGISVDKEQRGFSLGLNQFECKKVPGSYVDCLSPTCDFLIGDEVPRRFLHGRPHTEETMQQCDLSSGSEEEETCVDKSQEDNQCTGGPMCEQSQLISSQSINLPSILVQNDSNIPSVYKNDLQKAQNLKQISGKNEEVPSKQVQELSSCVIDKHQAATLCQDPNGTKSTSTIALTMDSTNAVQDFINRQLDQGRDVKTFRSDVAEESRSELSNALKVSKYNILTETAIVTQSQVDLASVIKSVNIVAESLKNSIIICDVAPSKIASLTHNLSVDSSRSPLVGSRSNSLQNGESKIVSSRHNTSVDSSGSALVSGTSQSSQGCESKSVNLKHNTSVGSLGSSLVGSTSESSLGGSSEKSNASRRSKLFVGSSYLKAYKAMISKVAKKVPEKHMKKMSPGVHSHEKAGVDNSSKTTKNKLKDGGEESLEATDRSVSQKNYVVSKNDYASPTSSASETRCVSEQDNFASKTIITNTQFSTVTTNPIENLRFGGHDLNTVPEENLATNSNSANTQLFNKNTHTDDKLLSESSGHTSNMQCDRNSCSESVRKLLNSGVVVQRAVELLQDNQERPVIESHPPVLIQSVDSVRAPVPQADLSSSNKGLNANLTESGISSCEGAVELCPTTHSGSPESREERIDNDLESDRPVLSPTVDTEGMPVPLADLSLSNIGLNANQTELGSMSYGGDVNLHCITHSESPESPGERIDNDLLAEDHGMAVSVPVCDAESKDSSPKYRCKFCHGARYTSLWLLQNHIEDEHPEVDSNFIENFMNIVQNKKLKRPMSKAAESSRQETASENSGNGTGEMASPGPQSVTMNSTSSDFLECIKDLGTSPCSVVIKRMDIGLNCSISVQSTDGEFETRIQTPQKRLWPEEGQTPEPVTCIFCGEVKSSELWVLANHIEQDHCDADKAKVREFKTESFRKLCRDRRKRVKYTETDTPTTMSISSEQTTELDDVSSLVESSFAESQQSSPRNKSSGKLSLHQKTISRVEHNKNVPDPLTPSDADNDDDTSSVESESETSTNIHRESSNQKISREQRKCNKKFPVPSTSNNSNNDGNLQPVSCKFCEDHFTNAWKLLHHVEEKHGDEDQQEVGEFTATAIDGLSAKVRKRVQYAEVDTSDTSSQQTSDKSESDESSSDESKIRKSSKKSRKNKTSKKKVIRKKKSRPQGKVVEASISNTKSPHDPQDILEPVMCVFCRKVKFTDPWMLQNHIEEMHRTVDKKLIEYFVTDFFNKLSKPGRKKVNYAECDSPLSEQTVESDLTSDCKSSSESAKCRSKPSGKKPKVNKKKSNEKQCNKRKNGSGKLVHRSIERRKSLPMGAVRRLSFDEEGASTSRSSHGPARGKRGHQSVSETIVSKPKYRRSTSHSNTNVKKPVVSKKSTERGKARSHAEIKLNTRKMKSQTLSRVGTAGNKLPKRKTYSTTSYKRNAKKSGALKKERFQSRKSRSSFKGRAGSVSKESKRKRTEVRYSSFSNIAEPSSSIRPRLELPPRPALHRHSSFIEKFGKKKEKRNNCGGDGITAEQLQRLKCHLVERTVSVANRRKSEENRCLSDGEVLHLSKDDNEFNAEDPQPTCCYRRVSLENGCFSDSQSLHQSKDNDEIDPGHLKTNNESPVNQDSTNKRLSEENHSFSDGKSLRHSKDDNELDPSSNKKSPSSNFRQDSENTMKDTSSVTTISLGVQNASTKILEAQKNINEGQETTGVQTTALSSPSSEVDLGDQLGRDLESCSKEITLDEPKAEELLNNNNEEITRSISSPHDSQPGEDDPKSDPVPSTSKDANSVERTQSNTSQSSNGIKESLDKNQQKESSSISNSSENSASPSKCSRQTFWSERFDKFSTEQVVFDKNQRKESVCEKINESQNNSEKSNFSPHDKRICSGGPYGSTSQSSSTNIESPSQDTSQTLSQQLDKCSRETFWSERFNKSPTNMTESVISDVLNESNYSSPSKSVSSVKFIESPIKSVFSDAYSDISSPSKSSDSEVLSLDREVSTRSKSSEGDVSTHSKSPNSSPSKSLDNSSVRSSSATSDSESDCVIVEYESEEREIFEISDDDESSVKDKRSDGEDNSTHTSEPDNGDDHNDTTRHSSEADSNNDDGHYIKDKSRHSKSGHDCDVMDVDMARSSDRDSGKKNSDNEAESDENEGRHSSSGAGSCENVDNKSRHLSSEANSDRDEARHSGSEAAPDRDKARHLSKTSEIDEVKQSSSEAESEGDDDNNSEKDDVKQSSSEAESEVDGDNNSEKDDVKQSSSEAESEGDGDNNSEKDDVKQSSSEAESEVDGDNNSENDDVKQSSSEAESEVDGDNNSENDNVKQSSSEAESEGDGNNKDSDEDSEKEADSDKDKDKCSDNEPDLDSDRDEARHFGSEAASDRDEARHSGSEAADRDEARHSGSEAASERDEARHSGSEAADRDEARHLGNETDSHRDEDDNAVNSDRDEARHFGSEAASDKDEARHSGSEAADRDEARHLGNETDSHMDEDDNAVNSDRDEARHFGSEAASDKNEARDSGSEAADRDEARHLGSETDSHRDEARHSNIDAESDTSEENQISDNGRNSDRDVGRHTNSKAVSNTTVSTETSSNKMDGRESKKHHSPKKKVLSPVKDCDDTGVSRNRISAIFECATCQRVFKSEQKLNAHMITHKNVLKYECDMCYMKFEHKRRYNLHKAGHQLEFVCPVCFTRYSSKVLLKYHMEQHKNLPKSSEILENNQEMYECDICGKKYQEQRRTLAHRSKHSPPKDGVICKVCDQKVAPLSLSQHKLLHSDDREHCCEFCGKKYRYLTTYKAHVNECRRVKREYKCWVCSKQFSEHVNLQTHFATHEDRRDYECPECEKRFNTKSALKLHLKTHDVVPRKHSCETCGMQFRERSKLETHIKKRHSDDKIFTCYKCRKDYMGIKKYHLHLRQRHNDREVCVCDICGYVCFSKGDLARHFDSNHEGSVQCDICSKEFKDKHNLERHKSTVHKAFSHFACDLCPKNFKNVAELNMHRLYHIDFDERFFKCVKCDMRFNTQGNLKRHMITHDSYSCQVCDRTYQTEEAFKRHSLIHKSSHRNLDKRFSKCGKCHKRFSDQAALECHMRTHKYGPFPCTDCDTLFRSEQALKQHLCMTHNKGEHKCKRCRLVLLTKENFDKHIKFSECSKKHICPHCQKEFARSRSLKIHIRTHTNERQYQCRHCGQQFNQDGDLSKHLYRAHDESEGPACILCKKPFKNERFYLLHMQKIHPDGKRKYQCDQCDDSFCVKIHLDRHMTKHTGKMLYHCEICNRGFNHKRTLQLHTLFHTGECPHKCDYCERRFKDKGKMKDHIRQVHCEDRPYACDHCSMRFKLPATKKNHMRVVHTTERNFACKECDATFKCQSTLKTHMLIHTGEKRYECTICHKRFAHQTSLTAHMRVHDGLRPYPCRKCGSAFTQRSHLRTHIKNGSCFSPFSNMSYTRK